MTKKYTTIIAVLEDLKAGKLTPEEAEKELKWLTPKPTSSGGGGGCRY